MCGFCFVLFLISMQKVSQVLTNINQPIFKKIFILERCKYKIRKILETWQECLPASLLSILDLELGFVF